METDRRHSSIMSVAMSGPPGRSERSTGGSDREVIAGGREATNARCVADVVEAKVTSVAVAPCRETRRLASSAIPGVASITTCGGCRTAAEPLRLPSIIALFSGGSHGCCWACDGCVERERCGASYKQCGNRCHECSWTICMRSRTSERLLILVTHHIYLG